MKPLIEIKNLSVDFHSKSKVHPAVKDVSFQINPGETLGLVGESGSGKSVTSLAIMGLLPSPPAQISNGEILFEQRDLLKLSGSEIRKIRGNRISMIFQEPMTSLNPVFSVGFQIVEALQLHQGLSNSEAWERATELLDQVGIPNASQRIRSYPHEMSGGQRQRVMIAMAIACEPDLLIADEPTTALDVTIQKQILELLADLQKKYGMSVLFITHDLGVIGEIADRVVVMYKGELVERADTRNVFTNAKHPYTKGLLACRPSLTNSFSRLPTMDDFLDEEGREKKFDGTSLTRQSESRGVEDKVLLEVNNLTKHYPIKKNWWGGVKSVVRAVDGVSFQVKKGQTLGLVGESGCGKTTLGRSILRLVEPSSGKVTYDSQDITALDPKKLREVRSKMQIIFQDPYASLNPRMRIGNAIMEPMQIHSPSSAKSQYADWAAHLVEKVGLQPDHLKRYPHEFSGGQRQRICIARALAVEPEFIVCDESVSALDVSIQAQIINLLMDLQSEFQLTYIFISHDLGVVKYISDDLAVMNKGKIVEMAAADEIYNNPQNSYTQKLLESVPKPIFS